MPRETRKQRAAQKQAQTELRARQQAAELARALERWQDFSHDSLQAIHRRSRASDYLTIHAAAEEDDRMDTSVDSAALSDAIQADISGTSRNQTPAGPNTLLGPSKCQGESEGGLHHHRAAHLGCHHSPFPHVHVGTFAHVIDKAQSPPPPPAVLRVQRSKGRMMLMATLTWTPHKKPPIIHRSDPRPLRLLERHF